MIEFKIGDQVWWTELVLDNDKDDKMIEFEFRGMVVNMNDDIILVQSNSSKMIIRLYRKHTNWTGIEKND